MGGIPKKEVTTTLMDTNTITITFPQVKINFNISDINFNTLENTVFDITQMIGRKVLEKALYDIDDRLRDGRPKGELRNTGKKQKYFLTRLGDIRYKRTRYIDKATGKSRYLLEEKLGIKINQRLSLLRAKVEIFLASIIPYRGARENIRLLAGYGRSHEALRQSVIKEAEGILRHEKHTIDKINRLEFDEDNSTPYDIAYMETDEAYIRLQRRRKQKGNNRRKRKKKSIAIKMAIGYTGRENRYRISRGRAKRLVNKFTYLGISNGKRFMENLSLIAEKKMSISRAKNLFFGGDGDRWITRGIQDFFTGAIYILCLFHLFRNIKRALPSRKEEQKEIKRLITQDKIDEALYNILKMSRDSDDMKEKEALEELYCYIRDNRKGINALKYIKDKEIKQYVRRTGAIEPNIDKVIAHRFKKRGMSWSIKGALSLLKIKETVINGEWDRWWSSKRDEKIEIDTEPLKQLTAKNFWKKGKDRSPLIEAEIPALQGPDRNEPWAKVIRQLQTIDYYK